MPTLSRRQLVLLVLLTVIWGLNWPVMKQGLAHFPPLTFRAISLVMGLPVIGLAVWLQKASFRIPREYWGTLIKLAIPNVVLWHCLMILAIPNLSSGRAAVVENPPIGILTRADGGMPAMNPGKAGSVTFPHYP